VREVPLSHESLNSGDVFIVDAGMTILQWNGANASAMERHKGAEMARALDDERGGLPKITVYSALIYPPRKIPYNIAAEGDNDAGPFWKALGGQGPVKPATAVVDADATATRRLFRLSGLAFN
jgi:gelsolin